MRDADILFLNPGLSSSCILAMFVFAGRCGGINGLPCLEVEKARHSFKVSSSVRREEENSIEGRDAGVMVALSVPKSLIWCT